MNTTLEQQIAAVNDAKKELEQLWQNDINIPRAKIITLNDAVNTLQAVRLIGIEKVMYAGEMFDLLSSGVGSGWLSWMAQKETIHSKINELILDKIHKYQP